MSILLLLLLTGLLQALWPTDPVAGHLWRPGAFWSLTLAVCLVVAGVLLVGGLTP